MDAEHGAPETPRVDGERVVDSQVLPVVIRSTPRYGRFLWTGVVVGLLVAVVLTYSASLTEQPGGPMSTGASGILWVFAVYAAVCVAMALLLMGLLVMVLARHSSHRVRSARAEHETTLVDDLRHPVTDDIPRWVLDAEDLAPGTRRADPDGGAPTGSQPRA
ncbi:MAG: hypothetical protein ABWY37_01245 [Microbacterium pygmaeum]